MLLSFIYFHRQRVIYFRSEGHWWAQGELCCCHSYILNANMSLLSKLRVTGGLGEILLLSVKCF